VRSVRGAAAIRCGASRWIDPRISRTGTRR
jgi:hypothetical protein